MKQPMRLDREDWIRLRNWGLPLLMLVGFALVARTAAECHTVLWFVGVHSTWPPTVAWAGLVWFWWLAVVVGLWRLAVTFADVFRLAWLPVLLHGAVAVALAFIHMSLLGSFIDHSAAIWPVWSQAHLARGCITGESFGQDLLIYGVLLLISSSIYHQLVARRTQLQKLALESQLTHAQLQALQNQVQPHFLFNAHNCVLSLIDLGRNAEAAEALSHLNAILRSSLLQKTPEKVPLADELKTVQSYLALQQIRFSDRLQVRFQTSPELMETLVPNFLLQPIVENAVHHGIEPMREGGVIETSVHREGSMVCFRVHDNGSGKANAATAGHGIGLRNLRERLEHLYPGRYTFNACPGKAGGFEVNIAIPFEPCRV